MLASGIEFLKLLADERFEDAETCARAEIGGARNRVDALACVTGKISQDRDRVDDGSYGHCLLQKLVPPRLCHRIFSGCQSFSQGVDGTILNSECSIAIFPMLNDSVGHYKGRRGEGSVRAKIELASCREQVC